MRAVAGGFTYDTTSATRVASRTCNEGMPCEYTETLFRTRGGSYFVYGVGQPESPYSRLDELARRVAAEGIVPITHAAALDWMRRRDVTTMPCGSVVTRPRVMVCPTTRDALMGLAKRAGSVDAALARLASEASDTTLPVDFMGEGRVTYRPRVTVPTLETLRDIGPDVGAVMDFLVTRHLTTPPER